MGGPARALEAILPTGAVAAELDDAGPSYDPGAHLFAEERPAVEGAGELRRSEFAGGRACARAALGLLGIAPLAIPVGGDGAPLWPAGIVGSITHKGAYRAAAVAPDVALAGLGVDAELDAPLPGGVLQSIALAGEEEEIARLAATDPTVHWDRLLFSAKEAAVKAAHPLGRGRPDLRATEVSLEARTSSFTARLALPHGQASPEVSGRWLLRGGLLIAVAAIGPATP